ncbi:phosphatidate cytidylyltransferase [Aliiroseovarius halocynthiae]|uniref:Phosphatidate cytidylyltransferase n=1 Tax=Aliiroseovarius halocynthiae TaxID=985055 RepID=A0A545SW33_9RHOB|nr:phosphatidate cytidylyltransferase [Aliiroseovarius halocynthiae]TQV69182.1 phosphatidate cytidylyltransferase [Aliiroseovarius halocynthiae]SMR71948.1 phosphatidate cytidylyltransferase [Aliiroseovarius halocynthiae]
MNSETSSSKWADLAPRLLSAIAMASVAGFSIWYGGSFYQALIILVIGLCMWEFIRLLQPAPLWLPVALGFAASGSLVLSVFWSQAAPGILFSPKILVLLIVPVLGAALLAQHRLLCFSYGLLIMLAGLGFIAMGPGPLLIWFILIIVMSDIAGYFAGRLIGGKKFWPRVSPKKTWSGTIAGWIGALALGVIGLSQGMFSPLEVIFIPLIAFAGQMGDIVQSAIKRMVGVKDSSQLIPGHGGVLDRFDAMIGAAGALVVLSAIGSLIFAG